ncbi:TPA: transcriptional regulator [Candidatus Delongbacteria bacterium]|nr:transcriptional regulator [Candidatus Delongbacteria bacterium]
MDNIAYSELSKLFKILGDPVRLQIIDLISCKEMCACEILEFLDITQSTLSHHMKILKESGIVNSRKDATWMRYSLNEVKSAELKSALEKITSDTPDCFCYAVKKGCKK